MNALELDLAFGRLEREMERWCEAKARGDRALAQWHGLECDRLSRRTRRLEEKARRRVRRTSA